MCFVRVTSRKQQLGNDISTIDSEIGGGIRPCMQRRQNQFGCRGSTFHLPLGHRQDDGAQLLRGGQQMLWHSTRPYHRRTSCCYCCCCTASPAGARCRSPPQPGISAAAPADAAAAESSPAIGGGLIARPAIDALALYSNSDPHGGDCGSRTGDVAGGQAAASDEIGLPRKPRLCLV